VLVDLVSETPIMRIGPGKFCAMPVVMGDSRPNEEVVINAVSAAEAVSRVQVRNMLSDLSKHSENDDSVVFTMHEKSLCSLAAGGFQIRRHESSEVVSTHSTLEDAWRALLLTVK